MNQAHSLNELEINLRRLPGVMAVAFEDRNAVLHVQLHIGGGASDPTLTDRATRLALQFATGSVAIEVNHWQGSRQVSSEQTGAVVNPFGGGHVGDTPDPRDAVIESETHRRESHESERVSPTNTSTMSQAASQAAGHTTSDSVGSEGFSNRRRGDAGATRDSTAASNTAASNWGTAPEDVDTRDTGGRSGPDSHSRTRIEPDTQAFLIPDTEPLDANSNEIFESDNSFLETSNEATSNDDVSHDALTDEAFTEYEANESSNDDPESAPSSVIDVTEIEKDESLGRAPRTRLLAVLTFPDTDELEVHLSYKGSRGIGRAPASRGVLGASEAAIEALRTWAPDIEYTAIWARPMENGGGTQSYLVATELNGPNNKTLHGLATGASPIEAAARATLHALNRTIAPALALIPEQS